MYHTTKDGKKIPIAELETLHIENILRMIERRAKEGVKIRYGGGTCAEDMWYEEEVIYGEEAKKRLNYKKYADELKRRELAKVS